MQTASNVLMVRPANFGFNAQTAENNYFQQKTVRQDVHAFAAEEFDRYVQLLRDHRIEVVVIQDTLDPHTPDSIFPNNWFSTHETGELVLYPMFAPNRRQERKPAVLDYLKKTCKPERIIDLTHYEQENEFLEGTGSMVIDHKQKIVYACRSERTSETVLKDFCDQMNFNYILFDAFDSIGHPIYHTNVMLTIGEKLAVICSSAIENPKERNIILSRLQDTGKEIIDITKEQVNRFAGNMLEVRNSENESFLIMSGSAKKSLLPGQINRLSAYTTILAPELIVIETNGGGSARCMLAEIFNCIRRFLPST